MPRKWLWIATIAFCTAALLTAAILCEAVRKTDSQTPNDIQDQAYRIIGVWNGRVAVYIPQTDTPETVSPCATAPFW